jgi:hypothetical protein
MTGERGLHLVTEVSGVGFGNQGQHSTAEVR